MKRITTPESIEEFRLALTNAVMSQAWQHATRGIPTDSFVVADVPRVNLKIARFMRDHCRALATHYNNRMEEIHATSQHN